MIIYPENYRSEMSPSRIISLVPSLTELLFDLRLDREVVGLTKFCVHPESWKKTKQVVGGTKQVHYDRIHNLHPDLIICNKEENTEEIVTELAKSYKVILTDISNIEEALNTNLFIGKTCDRETEAKKINTEIQNELSVLEKELEGKPVISCGYFIWRNPYMVAASETYIESVLNEAHFINIFAEKTRYPEIELQQAVLLNPDVIFLPSEPYPFSRKHLQFFEEKFPKSKCILVDGEMFTWYGSRMREMPKYLLELNNNLRGV